ncbi:MAG: glycerophosphodiester phosphodiesterase family protein [Anaerohalosphaeraceae bacterium]
MQMILKCEVEMVSMKKAIAAVMMCAGVVVVSSCSAGADMKTKRVEYVAHRGASYAAPENTLAAVELAWKAGADAVEVDVYLSADGRVMVIHDATTRRTTGVDMKVEATDSATLCTLDAGKFKGAEFAGQKIPYLEEVIATIPEGRRLYVELKSDERLVPTLEKMLDGNAHRKQIVFIGFDLDTISACKERMADIPAYWLVGRRKNEATGVYLPIELSVVQTARERRLEGLDVQSAGVTPELAGAIRAAGLELAAWTINDPAEARRLIELGAVSITTDRPDWVKQETEKLLKKN